MASRRVSIRSTSGKPCARARSAAAAPSTCSTGHFLPGTFDPPNFALRLAHKDVGLAVALGRELGVPMRLANLALEEMTEAMNRGWAERDSRVAMTLELERAGVAIKVDPERLRAILAADPT